MSGLYAGAPTNAIDGVLWSVDSSKGVPLADIDDELDIVIGDPGDVFVLAFDAPAISSTRHDA